MITLSTGELATWLGRLFWPFVRIGACLMVAPAFSATTVPVRIRIVLAGAIALVVAPLVPSPEVPSPLSAAGVVVTLQQVVIGVALGFSLRIIFDAVEIGGQLIANSMGLSFAYNVDPLHGTETPVVGQLYGILVLLTFLALDGHLRLIETLAAGFHTLPVGTAGLGTGGLWQLIEWGTQIFGAALAIALPGVAALTIVHLAFGVMSRAAPQLNLIAVGFPISLLLGLFIVFASLPMLQSRFVRLIGDAFRMVRGLSGAGV
ncbi:MAG TPA: flagellar biosynthetic protein FliR [Steroidobacteraceae bacterium]|nr:flagellar biosynthetic protein FliR [Steroidobacteraceae bacterium]